MATMYGPDTIENPLIKKIQARERSIEQARKDRAAKRAEKEVNKQSATSITGRRPLGVDVESGDPEKNKRRT